MTTIPLHGSRQQKYSSNEIDDAVWNLTGVELSPADKAALRQAASDRDILLLRARQAIAELESGEGSYAKRLLETVVEAVGE